MGELTAGGAAQAEELLGHELDGPVDIFVYDAREDFFGALGPGAREWFGAATFPPLRTIFMWLGAGPASYLDTTIVHEVTHIVFSDSTENPFHDPAKWLNEGLATWAEARSADDAARDRRVGGVRRRPVLVRRDRRITSRLARRGTTLSYAMGTTMVDMIIDDYGEDAIARIAGAYRAGASDDEALRGRDRRACRPDVRRLLRLVRRRRARSGRGGSHSAIRCRQAGQRPGSGRVRDRVAAGVVRTSSRRRRRSWTPRSSSSSAWSAWRSWASPGSPPGRPGAVARTGSRRERRGQPGRTALPHRVHLGHLDRGGAGGGRLHRRHAVEQLAGARSVHDLGAAGAGRPGRPISRQSRTSLRQQIGAGQRPGAAAAAAVDRQLGGAGRGEPAAGGRAPARRG